MLCTKALHRNTQLYCSASVNGNKLVVGQLDNIAVLFFATTAATLLSSPGLSGSRTENREDTVS